MATRAENIQTRLDQIAAELATTTWGPNVSDQGRSVDLVGYRKSLLEEQEQLQLALVVALGPGTVVSVAR